MPFRATLLALTVLLAGSASSASAQTGDPIHACVTKAGGKLRIVAAAGQCKSSETALSWNEAPPRPELVGFTTASVPGAAGVFEWTRTCAAQFVHARVCQVEELVLGATPTLISSPEDFAWVLPSNSASAQLAGTPPNAGVTCAVSDGGAGLVVNGHGFFGFRACGEAHRVACCAPPAQ